MVLKIYLKTNILRKFILDKIFVDLANMEHLYPDYVMKNMDCEKII